MNAVMEELVTHIEPVDTSIMAECHKKLSELEIPMDPNLCFLAERICGVRRTIHPEPLKKAVIIFAADHAVDGGENMTKGKNSEAEALQIAAGTGNINKIAHRIGAGVLLMDMGLQQTIPESEGVQNCKVMAGSHFFGKGAAMSKDEMTDAMMYGIQLAQQLADEGYTAIGLGNIGERGLLTAFTITAAFFRDKMNELPEGMGDDNKLNKLIDMLDKLNLDRKKPLQLLEHAGSPDIAAMVGFIISAAQRRLLVVFDNAVTGSAVLLAHALCHGVDPYVYPSARYAEPVHQMQMKKLGLKPFLQYDVTGDEGMGSALGLSLLDAAVRMLGEKI
jgi:nicotinate-nucleotide--dimethylbenzimidazole phosphoribosyltransferase